MQAIQLVEPEKFCTIEIPEPSPPGPGEALVRSHQCGICGTDVSGYLGKMPFFEYPRIPGHELGVEVVAVGSGVTQVAVGDRCSRGAVYALWSLLRVPTGCDQLLRAVAGDRRDDRWGIAAQICRAG